MKTSKKIALVLSGSGVYDGSEIHEATLSMYYLSHYGLTYEIFAPDVNQYHVINHLTGEEMNETRNVLIESARIARGKISDLKKYKADSFDGLYFPGGFGAAKNLSDWAIKGPEFSVNEDVKRAVKETVSAGKPVVMLCISPVIAARLFKDVELTIGDEEPTIKALESIGVRHKETTHGEVVVDQKYKIITTPCYMLDATIDQIGTGAENAVKKLMEMI